MYKFSFKYRKSWWQNIIKLPNQAYIGHYILEEDDDFRNLNINRSTWKIDLTCCRNNNIIADKKEFGIYKVYACYEDALLHGIIDVRIWHRSFDICHLNGWQLVNTTTCKRTIIVYSHRQMQQHGQLSIYYRSLRSKI